MKWHHPFLRPGIVTGPETCSDHGGHVFEERTVDPDTDHHAAKAGHYEHFSCAHCGAWAPMINERELAKLRMDRAVENHPARAIDAIKRELGEKRARELANRRALRASCG